MKNQMSDVNELIGKQMAESMETMLTAFHKLPEGMQTFLIGAHSISTGIEPVLGAFGNLAQVAGTLFPVAMAAAGEAIVGFLAALVGWPALIVAAVVAIGVVIYKYWDDIVAYFKKAVAAIGGFLTVDLPAAFDASVQTVAKWYYGVKFWLQDQFGALVDWVVNKIPEVTAAFKLAAEAIVFHSIVPDMIDGIGQQFNRLPSVMVGPALASISAVVDGFGKLAPVSNLLGGNRRSLVRGRSCRR